MHFISNVTIYLFLLVLCSDDTLGQLVETSANADLRQVGELFQLMRQPPITNVNLTAEFTDTRAPKYPLAREDIANHVESELKILQSQGLVSEENIEESRLQITESLVRFASNKSQGSISEYFYRDKIRLDFIIFRGTNVDQTTNTRPDRATTYVILDRNKSTDIPVLEVDPLGKSILKKTVASLTSKPILINAIRPNQFCVNVVLAMLVDTNDLSGAVSKRDESLIRMSHTMAIKLLEGSHNSGIKLDIVNNDVDHIKGVKDTVYKFRKIDADSSVESYMVIKIRQFLKTKNNVLKELAINLGSEFFLEDTIEYDKSELPSSFMHHEKSAEGDGHNFQFYKIEIKKIDLADVEKIFYATIPKEFFVEEEEDGQRRVAQNPYRLEPFGTKGARQTSGQISRSSKLLVRVVTISGMVLTTLALFYLVYKKQKVIFYNNKQPGRTSLP